MKPSSYYGRIFDVMKLLVRITVLMRPHAVQLVHRYSERKEAGVPIDPARFGLVFKSASAPAESGRPCREWNSNKVPKGRRSKKRRRQLGGGPDREGRYHNFRQATACRPSR